MKTEELEDLICRGCPLINDCEYLVDDQNNHCKAFDVLKKLTFLNYSTVTIDEIVKQVIEGLKE